MPALPDSKPSLTNSFVSRSRWPMYVAIEGLFSAEAAPFLLRLSDSLNGEVPMVVPAVFESTYIAFSWIASSSIPSLTLWNVQNTGLELSAWLLPPNIFFAASALFTTITGSFPSCIW